MGFLDRLAELLGLGDDLLEAEPSPYLLVRLDRAIEEAREAHAAARARVRRVEDDLGALRRRADRLEEDAAEAVRRGDDAAARRILLDRREATDRAEELEAELEEAAASDERLATELSRLKHRRREVADALAGGPAPATDAPAATPPRVPDDVPDDETEGPIDDEIARALELGEVDADLADLKERLGRGSGPDAPSP